MLITTPSTRILLRTLGATAALLLSAAALLAQTDTVPASRTVSDAEVPTRGRQRVDASVSILGGHVSNNAKAEAGEDEDPPADRGSGVSTNVNTSGRYQWEGTHIRMGASASSNLRYFGSAGSPIRTTSHSAAIGLSGRLGGKSTLVVNQTAAYSPSHLYTIFPGHDSGTLGEALPSTPDYEARDAGSVSYGTDATLSYGLGRRSSAVAGGSIHGNRFIGESSQGNSRWWSFRGGWSRELSRNVGLNTTYRLQAAQYDRALDMELETAGGQTTEHGVDLGLSYARRLSASRSLSFSIAIGASVVNGMRRTSDDDSRAEYRASASGAVVYPFSRNWRLRGAYNRGMQFVAGLPEPVFVDGFSAGAGTVLASRLGFDASGRYARGASPRQEGPGVSFDTYSLEARLSYPVTRTLAARAEYVYYVYDFRGDAPLSPVLTGGLKRTAVRIGLSLAIPHGRR